MNRIIYSPKVFYQILLPIIFILATILYDISINSSKGLKVNINLVYIILLCLLLMIAWFILGKFEIIVSGDKFIIRKKLLSFSFFTKSIKRENIDKIIFTKDPESNYRIGTTGYRYYLKFDYGLNFLLNANKDFILDTGNKENSMKVLSFLKKNKIIVIKDL